MNYTRLRPLLFRLDPERAHALTLGLLRLAGALPPAGALVESYFRAPDHPIEAFGLRFRNPVGLAAGYDKDGLGWRGLARLGFGHLELGTVTPLAQPGNPQPRLFRIPEEGALINRMGFPGKGADFMCRRLESRRLGSQRPGGLVLGVNIGKNKDTPLEQAQEDYLALVRLFAPLADYLAVNISSPNTPGLRSLQAGESLQKLLAVLQAERQAQEESMGKSVPLLVKLAPDLDEAGLDGALDAILDNGVDGVIATNTTIRRDRLRSSLGAESGGLSGAPLEDLSTALVARITRLTAGKLPVIGVGGVMDPASARRKLDAGAVLVQVYTGLVYAGPGLVRQIVRGLV